MTAKADYNFLCLHCGFITPFFKWSFWVYTDRGIKLPASDSDDAVLECPVCSYEHKHGRNNGLLKDGRASTLNVERARVQAKYVDRWKKTNEGVFGIVADEH